MQCVTCKSSLRDSCKTGIGKHKTGAVAKFNFRGVVFVRLIHHLTQRYMRSALAQQEVQWRRRVRTYMITHHWPSVALLFDTRRFRASPLQT